MGYISFNLGYYENALYDFENNPVTEERVYKAKQLLKMVDDNADEGYNLLYNQLEEKLSGYSRLRQYILSCNEVPFDGGIHVTDASDLIYSNEKVELEGFLQSLKSVETPGESLYTNSFVDELISFSNWIGYEEDTAYVFLLRDTLLPYLFFLHKGRKQIYPWLIGREMTAFLTGVPDADDEIRGVLIEALEEGGVKCYDQFCDYALPRIRKTVDKYPLFASSLRGLIKEIPAEKIVVVESGCHGTYPMLMASLDDRVSIRMFTTVPYLTDIYGKLIFTKAYEKNRMFETLFVQDKYIRFAGFESGRFFVEKCMDKKIEDKAMNEIWQMIN